MPEADAAKLRDAWLFASRARSAMTLWTAKTADVLPTDRQQLEGVARLLEYPPGRPRQLEEDYLRITRLARRCSSGCSTASATTSSRDRLIVDPADARM